MPTSPFDHYSKSETRFQELYEVVRAAHVVNGDRKYLVEILLCHTDPAQGPYTAQVYREEKIDGMKPKIPGKETRWQESWVPLEDFPVVHRDTVDSALYQAFLFLHERTKQS